MENENMRSRTIGVAAVLLVLTACASPDDGGPPTTDSDALTSRSARISPSASAAASRSPSEPAGRLTAHPVGETDAPRGYYEYVPPGYGDGEPHPLLVFLHGYGSNGDGTVAELGALLETGIPALIARNAWPEDRPFVVLAPQHDFPQEDAHYAACEEVPYGPSCWMEVQHNLGHPEDGSACTTPTEVHSFISHAIATYEVDPGRVYLVGLSCGAYAAYEYVAEFGATQVAAVVAMAGDARPAWDMAGCELGDVALWAFHGDADDVVDPAGSMVAMQGLADCPEPRQDAVLTVYPGVGHDAWTRTLDLTAGHDIYEGLLAISRP